MATVLTQTADLLKHAGWVFHREGELISPDSRWVIKTGYSNFESYLQLQVEIEGQRNYAMASHLRLHGDRVDLPAVLAWLTEWGIHLGP